MEYTDPFGTPTRINILPSLFNGRISFVIDKERRNSTHESWSVENAKEILLRLSEVIDIIEKHKKEKHGS